jgi:hypothetical protein
LFIVLAHSRRRVLHFNVTENPTVHWTAQQIVEAFPWDSAPKYLLRDRDAIYGGEFRKRIHVMGIEQVRILGSCILGSEVGWSHFRNSVACITTTND